MGFLCLLSFGQAPTESSVTGQVVEYLTGEPFQYVDVVIYPHDNDSSQLAGNITDREGKFEFKGLKAGKYKLVAKMMNAVPQVKTFALVDDNEQLELGKIRIEMEFTADSALIEGKRSVYAVKSQKRIYNVSEDLVAQTGLLTDVLRNIPSVTIGVDGNVSLRGTSNITYLINGRPSALLRNNPMAVLSQIPANNIERVEVITAPSAKYRPDGAGGIINIVLKKKVKDGVNATIQGNMGNLQRRGLGLNLNYNLGNVNLFGNYAYKSSETPRDIMDERIDKDGRGGIESSFTSLEDITFGARSHIASAGANFEVGENGFFEIEGNYIFINNNNISTTDWTVNDLQLRNFTVDRNYDGYEIEYDLGVAYEHSFGEDHELTFDFAYDFFDEREDNFYREIYTNPSNGLVDSRNLILKVGPTIETAIDYVRPIGKESELEVGYFGQFIDNDITTLIQDQEGEVWNTNEGRSSEFAFEQNIHALYANFSRSFDVLSITAGLRAEQALITSNLITTNTVVPNDYFKLYPSLNLTYELGDFSEIYFNYSKRVNRADPDEQNPFPEYKSPRERDAGNPLLLPEQIHAGELGVLVRNENLTFAPTLFYRYTFDAFTEFWEIQEDSILHTSFTNSDSYQEAGLEFALIGSYKNTLQYNWSSTIFYNEIDGSNLGLSGRKSNITWETKANIQVSLTNATFLQLNAHYQSERLTPQGAFKPIFLLNTGLRQDILKKRASIILMVSDVFASLIFESVVDTDLLFRQTNYGRNRQIVQVGFTYNLRHSGKRSKVEGIPFEDAIEKTRLPIPEEE